MDQYSGVKLGNRTEEWLRPLDRREDYYHTHAQGNTGNVNTYRKHAMHTHREKNHRNKHIDTHLASVQGNGGYCIKQWS